MTLERDEQAELFYPLCSYYPMRIIISAGVYDNTCLLHCIYSHIYEYLYYFYLPGSKSTGGGPSTSSPAKPVPIYFGMEQQRRASGMGARSMTKLNVVFSFKFKNCLWCCFFSIISAFPAEILSTGQNNSSSLAGDIRPRSKTAPSTPKNSLSVPPQAPPLPGGGPLDAYSR